MSSQNGVASARFFCYYLFMDWDLTKQVWWEFLQEDQRDLFKETEVLTGMFEARYKEDPAKLGEFIDYSFLVFPAAKAYEGFLKKFFLTMGFITREEYAGKHFRIGRALNPSLDKILREQEGVYDRIAEYCQGKELADLLWDTWRTSRNQTFHWFPGEANTVTFEEAKARIGMVYKAMEMVFRECKLTQK